MLSFALWYWTFILPLDRDTSAAFRIARNAIALIGDMNTSSSSYEGAIEKSELQSTTPTQNPPILQIPLDPPATIFLAYPEAPRVSPAPPGQVA